MKLRFIDVDGIFAWTRSIKISMESAFTPAPLWRLAWRMGVQMSPGRAYGWDGGGGGGWFCVVRNFASDWSSDNYQLITVNHEDVGFIVAGPPSTSQPGSSVAHAESASHLRPNCWHRWERVAILTNTKLTGGRHSKSGYRVLAANVPITHQGGVALMWRDDHKAFKVEAARVVSPNLVTFQLMTGDN
jgi:hypothetical protein